MKMVETNWIAERLQPYMEEKKVATVDLNGTWECLGGVAAEHNMIDND